MPPDVLKQAAIGTISSNGFCYIENELTLGKLKNDISRKAKSKVKTHTIDEYREMARNTVVNNDSLFSHISEEEKDRRNDIKKYSQFSFWNSLTIKDGFKIQLKQVIPDFWNSEMESMSKKTLLEKLKNIWRWCIRRLT